MKEKHNIISNTGKSCIIKPQIPCKNRKNKKTKESITKILLTEDINEFKINNLVRKIKDNKKWTLLWNDMCISEDYDSLLKYNNVKNCFDENSIQNHYFLLQGVYGGLPLDEYMNKYLTDSILTNKDKFIKTFKKIFKLLKNVFYGLTQLSKNNICHLDIASKNIIIKNNKTYIIDYDLSVLIDKDIDNSRILKRMINEYNLPRIYETYPIEFIYYPLMERKEILRELELIDNNINILGYYEFYKIINDFFNINTRDLRYNLLEEKLRNSHYQNFDDLLKKLDVYSLASMIMILFIDACNDKNIDINIVFQHMKDPELNEYMILLKDMLTFDYKNRPDMKIIYKRYLNLIRNKRKTHKKKQNA
tara:strand:- start:1026 stop:2114 length:1089 start_codon:yes stop_codon:yes gene_type:complete